jgi:hypothetical protein
VSGVRVQAALDTELRPVHGKAGSVACDAGRK